MAWIEPWKGRDGCSIYQNCGWLTTTEDDECPPPLPTRSRPLARVVVVATTDTPTSTTSQAPVQHCQFATLPMCNTKMCNTRMCNTAILEHLSLQNCYLVTPKHCVMCNTANQRVTTKHDRTRVSGNWTATGWSSSSANIIQKRTGYPSHKLNWNYPNFCLTVSLPKHGQWLQWSCLPLVYISQKVACKTGKET